MMYKIVKLKDGAAYSYPYKAESATEEISLQDRIISVLDDRSKNLQEQLNDVMGLLMNHEQHDNPEWQKDYNELCDKYMEDLIDTKESLSDDALLNKVQAEIEKRYKEAKKIRKKGNDLDPPLQIYNQGFEDGIFEALAIIKEEF